jgi:hypothetical protein
MPQPAEPSPLPERMMACDGAVELDAPAAQPGRCAALLPLVRACLRERALIPPADEREAGAAP